MKFRWTQKAAPTRCGFSFRRLAFLWATTLSLLLTLNGCAETPTPTEASAEASAAPKQKVFSDGFDDVWMAAQRALAKYPIKVNDMDSGVIETDFVRGDHAWVSPHNKKPLSGGRKYILSVNVVKGKVDADQKSAVRVTVSKRAELQKDFFSSSERVSSDGLEETSVMYRIERELFIARSLKKVKLDSGK